MRMLVGYPPGGLTDTLARLYADALSSELGVPCIVENKPGAGASLAFNELKSSPPDGYHFAFSPISPLLLNRFSQPGLSWTTEQDFRFILGLPGSSSPIFVRNDLPIRNLADFVQYARANGGISVGSYGVGSFGDMVYAEIAKEFDITLDIIQYQGEGPMWLGIMNGSLDAALGSYSAAVPVIESGTGRPIAVTRERHGAIPDVPTLGEQGGTSAVYNLVTFMNCTTLRTVPEEIVNRVGEIMVRASFTEAGERILRVYNPDYTVLGPAEAQALFERDLPTWLRMGQEMASRAPT
jgi:tripartite-type tricarboxylate transporter receptor subunit TctC